MQSYIKSIGLCFVGMGLLIGCAQDTISRAPVEDINRAPPKMAGIHTVQEGESFYMIAWRYNRDALSLAQANGLRPPYHLQVGQKINLGAPPKPVIAAAQPRLAVPVQASLVPKTVYPSSFSSSTWEWPSSGKIIGHFSAQNAQKGIDIAGQSGQSVIVAAPGVVVYSGSGLRGYGQMVIVKHNDQFLSAYAHNSRILVKEGDLVKAHEKIAEMGQTDTESVRLHFEIRKNGQPVDPLLYLPKRKVS